MKSERKALFSVKSNNLPPVEVTAIGAVSSWF